MDAGEEIEMNIHKALAYTLLSAGIVGCGGSKDSGENNNIGSRSTSSLASIASSDSSISESSSRANDSSSSDSISSEANLSGDTSQAPKVSILFPPEHSYSTSETVLVRGTASDLEGDVIRSVKVNGIEVTTNDGYATWQVSVPINGGANTLSVFTEDSEGNRNDLASFIEVEGEPASMAFPICSGWGKSRDKLLLTTLQGLLEVDPKTGERNLLVRAAADGSSICRIRAGETDDQIYAISFPRFYDPIESQIISLNIRTGERRVIASKDVGSGADFSGPSTIAFDEANNRILYTSEVRDQLIAIDINSGVRTILSEGEEDSAFDITSSQKLILNPGNNTAYILVEAGNLLEVDLSDGSREIISGSVLIDGEQTLIGEGPLVVTRPLAEAAFLDSDSQHFFLVGEDKDTYDLISIDIATGDRQKVFNFYEDYNIYYLVGLLPGDESTSIVTLDALDAALVSIDFSANQSKALIASNEIGQGPKLDDIRNMVPDFSNNRLIGVDNNIKQLVAIDLISGDRTILSAPGIWGQPYSATTHLRDLALDSVNNRVLVVEADNTISSIDLATGERSVFSMADGDQAESGNLYTINIDRSNNRLIAGFEVNGGGSVLVGVDLETGVHSSLVTSTDQVPLISRYGSALSDDGNTLFSTSYDNLFSVDINSGERHILADNSDAQSIQLEELENVILDSVNNRALVVSGYPSVVYGVDLAYGTKELLLDSNIVNSELWIAPNAPVYDPDRDMLWLFDLGLKAVMAFDLTTGESVVVSR